MSSSYIYPATNGGQFQKYRPIGNLNLHGAGLSADTNSSIASSSGFVSVNFLVGPN